MTRVRVRKPAPEGAVFAPEAFAGQLGEGVPVRTVHGLQEARLLGADVAGDGRSVLLTLDLPDEAGAGTCDVPYTPTPRPPAE